jgi:hypothetical protein
MRSWSAVLAAVLASWSLGSGSLQPASRVFGVIERDRFGSQIEPAIGIEHHSHFLGAVHGHALHDRAGMRAVRDSPWVQRH